MITVGFESVRSSLRIPGELLYLEKLISQVVARFAVLLLSVIVSKRGYTVTAVSVDSK